MAEEVTASEEVVGDVVAKVAPVEPVATDAPEVPADASTVTPTEGEFVPVTEEIIYSDMKYGGMDVNVTVPVEVANLAGEKGIDIQAVSKELYDSEDFSLSEATLGTLYDAFGKFQVDTYLRSVKAGNDQAVNDYNTQVEYMNEAEKGAWEATMEVMGGEDKWDDLSAYALSNMEDDELDEFNEIMKTGTPRMQQLMIKDVYSRFKEAGAPVAPTVLDLEEGQTGGVSDGTGPLTGAEFLKLITSGEYKKDPEKYDTLRRQGLAKGI